MTQTTLKASVIGFLFFLCALGFLAIGEPRACAALAAIGAACPAGVLFVRLCDWFGGGVS